jgi:hypothetical protein
MNQEELDDYLGRKKILSEVQAARGYISYAEGQLEPILKAFSGFADNQQRWAKNKAKKSGGFIMLQHAFAGLELLPIPPQLKPDVAPLKARWDFHPSSPPPKGFVPMIPGTTKPLSANHWSTAWAMRQHILRNRGDGCSGGQNCRVARKLSQRSSACSSSTPKTLNATNPKLRKAL